MERWEEREERETGEEGEGEEEGEREEEVEGEGAEVREGAEREEGGGWGCFCGTVRRRRPLRWKCDALDRSRRPPPKGS